MPIQGADISDNQWRLGLPFSARKGLLSAGVRFLWARASIGLTVDAAFARTRARSAVFDLFGGYHYLTEEDTLRQYATFARVVHNTGGLPGISAALDIEDDNTGPILNKPSLRQVKDWVAAFRADHPNGLLAAYSNDATWARLGNPDVIALGFDYAWQADYRQDPPPFPVAPPQAFGGVGRAPMWQYGPLHFKTPNGKGHHVDGDVFYGTTAELKALVTGQHSQDPGHGTHINARNAELTDIVSSIQSRPAPTGPADYVAGVISARDAAVEAVRHLKTGG